MGRLGFAMASEHWTGRWKHDWVFFLHSVLKKLENLKIKRMRMKESWFNIKGESRGFATFKWNRIQYSQSKIKFTSSKNTNISTWKQHLFKNNLILKLYDYGTLWETSSPIGWQSKLITPSTLLTHPTPYNFILLMKILKRILEEHNSQQTRQRNALE